MSDKVGGDSDAVSGFCDEIALCNRRLARFTSGLTLEELRWRPSGINNSIEWILTHIASQLWLCHSLVTGLPMKFNPLAAVPAYASWRGIQYGSTTQLPTPAVGDPTKKLFDAWNALKTALRSAGTNLDEHRVYGDRKWHSARWFLSCILADFAYHTGQASYLRKLIAAKRSRSKSRGSP